MFFSPFYQMMCLAASRPASFSQVALSSPTNILTSFTPPQKGAGMMLEGDDKATCDKLAGIMAAKHMI